MEDNTTSVNNNTVTSCDLASDPMKDCLMTDATEVLKCSLKDGNRILDLFYMNKFDEVKEIYEKYAETTLYHSLARSFITSLYALLTLESDDVKNAKAHLSKSLHLCSKFKKSNSIVENLTSFIWKVDYDKYTDTEVHAELISAECNTLMALLTFLGDQNFISLIKGAFQVRAANNGYKFCYDILLNKNQWDFKESQFQFECGTSFGVGIFNLYLSITPPKILKLLSLVGFSGDRNLANSLLLKATEMKSAIRYRIAAMAIHAFYLYVEQLGGKGLNDTDYEWCKELLDDLEEKFPKAVFVKVFAAKFRLIKGEPKKAIEDFQLCINIQDSWKQIHNICYWDLVWGYAIQCDWENAYKHATLLRHQCMYSPATNAYQMAVFKMMQMVDEDRDDLKEEVNELMKLVPTLKIRYAGKTIPPEKFLCTRALQYTDSNPDSLVSLLELFYVWYAYAMIPTSELATPFLERINKKVEEMNRQNSSKYPVDSICVLMLAKGVLLRNLGCYEESIAALEFIINNAHKIERDTYIAPHAALELAITCLKHHDYESSHNWLRKAKSNQVKMLNDAVFQLRAHSVSKCLKVTRKDSSIST